MYGGFILKKLILPIALTASLLLPSVAFGAGTYKVVGGDTLWKVAVKNQVGITEIINANPQVKNINMIYPGQTLNIPSNNYQSIEQQVVKLVNAERAKVGVKPLTSDWELARVARFKSEDMRDNRYFDHNSPIYGTPFQMMKSFGINYRAAGENIAAGQTTAESVMKAWMNSPGHKQNILSPNFTHIGVGYAKGGSYGHYWTQQFMSK
jgi:uncharacterized YkwD family protein/spore coat assembly protein SafA